MYILITGASKGIGRELAKSFARFGNSHLFLFARSESLLESLKEECLALNPNCEVTVYPHDLKKICDDSFPLPEKLKHVDVLINNAGYLVNKKFQALSDAEFHEMTDTNFLLPASLIRKLLGRMGGEISTHVVNIGSMGGVQGSVKFPGLSIYSATKAALAVLTECLAAEFSDTNIYFNCLALGAVRTEMLETAFPGYQAPLKPGEMAEFIMNFALNGHHFLNGKIVPVSLSTP